MYGAIIGDIVGSRFEFDNGNKSKEFELFTAECDFTDDTVMTVAVAEALMDAGKDADEKTVKDNLIKSMKKWGQKYPHAGYGARFISWVLTDDPQPYGSYGNGSGMRVSPAGWLYDTIERTREVARWTADVTHNHPEGIKGAESTAAAIFLARHGASMEEIQNYLVNEFGYDLSRTLDDIRPSYYHVEDCMRTMPEAFKCFLESESYEDCLRNVMYIGGDTDTLGAIAGAIAEAYWGIPLTILQHLPDFISNDIWVVINRFQDVIQAHLMENIDNYSENNEIKSAIERIKKTHNDEDVVALLAELIERIKVDGQAPTPMEDVSNVMGELDPETIVTGNEFSLNKELRLKIHAITDDSGLRWIPLFTDEKELFKQETTTITLNMPIRIVIEDGLLIKDVEGVVINPFGNSYPLHKELLAIVMKRLEAEDYME